MVDQGGDKVDDVVDGEAVAGADLLGGGKVDAAGEDRKASPEPLLGRRAQAMAPLDGGAQTVVRQRRAGRRVVAEKGSVVIQLALELLDGAGVQPGRG
ncbi:hypothetical protein [Nonomuraea sp. SYSU D8015]|uniref:hypothetical protein n=1 Tax=Nonomuraea sp. SYSU D8015 TaxID=2593644 RepID=UPI0016611F1A|nr:hypothetical protein [Nonomuraea sp. SYSU D8015]